MADHAVYSASGSERWLNCAGSIKLAETAPPERSSRYASEGTTAHEVLEIYLKAFIEGKPPKVDKKKYNADMVEHGFNAYRTITKDYEMYFEATLLAETKSELPVSEPNQFGTFDAAIIERFGRLVIYDYKYGAGIAVDPEENSQLIFYALGIAHKYNYEFNEVELVVIQPRAANSDGETVKRWLTTVEVLIEWREKFENAIKRTKAKKPSYKAGDWCRFCRAATICPELSERSLVEVRAEFDPVIGDLKLPEVSGEIFQIKNLPNILKACDKLDEWIKKVRSHAFDVMNQGGIVQGFKLVDKRSIRKWADEEQASNEAMAVFGNDVFAEPKLLSPAQLEALVKKKKLAKEDARLFIETYSTSKSSGVTMVAESDKRPATNYLNAEFDEIPEFLE